MGGFSDIMTTVNFQDVLKGFYNHSPNHCHILKTKELSFLNPEGYPEYGTVMIEMFPDKKVAELKSVKIYLHKFREVCITPEELLSIIYEDFSTVYQPRSLSVKIHTTVRGGLSNTWIKSGK